MKVYICMICLRTDKQLKLIHKTLVEFHDEICEFALPTPETYYCSECEHLLRKFYKFQKKCMTALKTFVSWKTTKAVKRQPIAELHTMLPPSSLGPWIPGVHVGKITILQQTDSNGVTTDHIIQDESNVALCPKEEVQDFVPVAGSTVEAWSEKVIEIKEENDDQSSSNMNIRDFIRNSDLVTDMNDSVDNEKIDNDESTMFAEELSDDDDIDEEFLKSLECIGYDSEEEGQSDSGKNYSSKQRYAVNLEKLKSDLLVKLSSCGEILANDGTPIDKEMILNCIQHKVPYQELRSLRAAMRGTLSKTVTDKLKEHLNSIHEKFKDDEKFETVFEIQYLPTYKSKVAEFEKRKTYEAYVNAEHKCEICYMPFRTKKYFLNHKKTYHDETAEGEICSICNARVVNLRRHAVLHGAVYKCKLCPMITYYRGTMKNHFGSHTGKIYRCENCDVTYKCMSGYFLHLSRFHRRGCHVCAACGRGFPSALALISHRRIHLKDKPAVDGGENVRCDKCDVTFPSQAVFDVHLADVHETRVPEKLRFRDSNSLPLSFIRNWKERKFKQPRKFPRITCRLCNASRTGSGWLRTHFKKEHPTEDFNLVYADLKVHLCDVCGIGFSSLYALRDHMYKHTGARPYACDVCSKTFSTNLLMKDHRSRHFPPTHLCTVCGKKFKTKSNLFNHVRVHTGDKVHVCKLCGKAFLYSHTLNEHINGVHYNIRRVRKRATERRRENTCVEELVPMEEQLLDGQVEEPAEEMLLAEEVEVPMEDQQDD